MAVVAGSSRARATLTAAEYYSRPAVQARLREYCGLPVDGAPTSLFLAALPAPADEAYPRWELARPVPPDRFERLLRGGRDLARSLWDRESLLVHLDLDYVNIDRPAEPFTHPAETFFRLEPLHAATRLLAERYRMPLACLMTGRGYHFAGRVPLDHPVVDRLAALHPADPPWFGSGTRRRPAWLAEPLPARQARAHAGLGLVLELLAHDLFEVAAGDSPVPVVLNGTIVGTGISGRACASIDLTAFGDPLDVRMIRSAFSVYELHRVRPDLMGAHVAAEVPPLAAVPRGWDESLVDVLARGRTLGAAAAEASQSSALLPSVARGVERLADAYEPSALAAFHRGYHAELDVSPAPIRDVAARLARADLPPCVLAPFEHPNDLLLRPAHVQHVTRALLSAGWTAPDIARLLRAAYEADHAWGDRWSSRMHARTRAEYEVRVWAGLIAAGLDRGVDFNCTSAQEKDLCPRTGCPHDLRVDRDRLLERLAP